MRYFFSTGEASGEFAAVVLAQTIARIDPQAQFEGIGAHRMRQAGFALWRDHTGWDSLGPFAAIPKIPKLFAVSVLTALHVARTRPDAVVLVDFGAFNVRLAKGIRSYGYRGPVIDVFPPGAWLDSARTAKAVSQVAVPLSAFEHQAQFYRSNGLPVTYFGHPLASQYRMREARPAAAPQDGIVAILPGSRPAEIKRHAPVVFAAYRDLKRRRPQLRAVVGAANERAMRDLRRAARAFDDGGLEFVHGTRNAIAQADAAWVASGTAVLECALSGVPAITFYIVSNAEARYARRKYSGRFYTLANLVLEREVMPELMQERATPAALAQTMNELLADPQRQYAELVRLRESMGPPNALERCAAFIVAAARGAIT